MMVAPRILKTETHPDLSALTEDGNTVEWMGKVYRLRIEADQIPVQDLWSDDCYGKISDAHDYHDAQEPRSDGFTGNAEKVQFDRGYWCWWEPPADVPRGSPQFDRAREIVRDLLQFGWQSVGLEETDGSTDAYGRPIVVRAAWIGGVEPMAYSAEWLEYLQELLRDLYAELS